MMTGDVATEADVQALQELMRAKIAEGEAFRKQAEHWIAGLAAVTGLVATVSLVKGSSDSADYDQSQLFLVVGLLVAAFLMLAAGTLLAYTAAYGSPGRLEQVETSPLPKLASRLVEAKENQAKKIGDRLRLGVWAGVIGAALLMLAGVVMLLPQGGTPPAKTVCIYVGSTKVVTVAGSSVNVATTGPEARIGPC